MQFTREQLPVGSVIVLAEGWQYRPEGWVNGEVNTSANRPTTTTASYVEITEEWWGNYTTRAFNISKVGLSSLSGVTEADICEAFQIYVPTRAHIHTYSSVTTPPTCAEQGYTTYTCECGDSYVADYVDAPGHTYEPADVVIENEVASTWDKVGSYDEVVYCSACGEEISRETKAALLYPFYNDAMELSSQLTLHFIIKLDTLGLGTDAAVVKQSGYYAVVTRLGADGKTYDTTIPATDWQGHTKNRMRIPFNDWKPTQMADALSVVIYNKNGEAVSSAKETSVRQVAMYEIEQYIALGGYDSYVTLLVDMLNYGAASQQSFGYNTGDYANALLTDAQKAYATADAEYSARQDNSSVTFYQAPAFELKSKVEMWLILTAAFDVTNVKAEVTYTNFKGVVKTQPVTEFAEHTKGRHKLIINWLNIPDCTQDITVVFKDLQGNVLGTVNESVAASLGYFSELVPDDPIYPTLIKFINSAYAYLNK